MMYSYLQWLFLFAFLPLIILYILNRRILNSYKKTLLFAVVGGIVFSFPWDYIAIHERIWYFTTPHIAGIWFGGLPLEEYLFIILETVLFTTITLILLEKKRKL